MKQARIKAKRRYKDIQENRSIKKNEVYVVSLKRAEEIVKANLCDIVDIYDVKDIEVITTNSLNDLTKNQLIDIAKEKQLKTTGTKKQLIERLIKQ